MFLGTYGNRLAEATGFRHYPKSALQGGRCGLVLGVQEGYIVAFGPTTRPRSRDDASPPSIVLRFKFLSSPAPVMQAVDSSLPDFWTQIEVRHDTIIWTLRYLIFRPTPRKVTGRISALIAAIRGVAPVLDGRCEICGLTSPEEVSLFLGVPGYYCTECRRKQESAGEAGRQIVQEGSLGKAILLGSAAAVVGSAAVALAGSLFPERFAYLTTVVGGLVAYAVCKVLRQVGRKALFLTGFLTLGGVFLANLFFYTVFIWKANGMRVDRELARFVADTFLWTMAPSTVRSLFWAIFGAAFVVCVMLPEKKAFESLK